MFRKSFLSILFLAAIIAVGQIAVFAQNAPVSGTVEMQKPDGTREPVAGAVIEVYRTDIKTGFPSLKTGKRGDFGIAGLALGGQFTFSVSAPGIAPEIFPGVKAGQERLLLIVVPGDGSKFTEDQVRKNTAAAAGKTTGPVVAELTAEQKKEMAANEAKIKEVTSKNEKAAKTNEITTRVIKEGNDAYDAKNYDVAIAKYAEGIAADPEFIGSAPIFYNNRGAALTARAVETYNRTVKAADTSEKVAGMGKTKKDFAEAADGYLKGWNVLKNAAAAETGDRAARDATKLVTLRGSKDTFLKAVRTEQVDPLTIEAAKVLIPESLNIETDPIKKAQVQTMLGDLYRVSSNFDGAIVEYRKALEMSKDSPDALAGLGLSLVNVGIIAKDEGDANKDKTMSDKGTAQMQEGLNFLGVFAKTAPDTHPLKASVKETTEYLSAQNNLSPQKVTPQKAAPGRKKN